ncbi:MAG: polysaccharide deacetylase family protein [Candidatus Limnocylindria bacterium]
MPPGWRRPVGFLLTVVLAVAGCAPSASPVESAAPSPSAAPTVASPTPAPTPTPTLGPTPVASGCRAGNRVPTGEREIIGAAPQAGEAMALTFDMGGRLDPAIDIMNFLVANQVCTTLFPTGAMSETPVGQEVLAIVRDHPELFELGNHTMHHCNLRDGGLGSPTEPPCATGGPPTTAFIAAELTDAATILESGSGQDPVPYWRPPYGSYDETVLATAAAAGYTKTIMWSIDTIDWRPIVEGGPTAEQMATGVITSASSGSIVLMHLGGYETLAALEIMVPALRDRGLLLTSVSDLLN